MNIKEIGYSRKFNLGNYETEEINLTATLEELEDISEAFRELKQTVFGLQAEGVDAEPPRITQTTGTPVSWLFNPQEFLDHEWKGKRLDDGSYSKGSCSWGWDFAFKDKDHNEPNFSEASLKVLENGSIRIGDDYEVQFNESKTLVQIQKIRKKK